MGEETPRTLPLNESEYMRKVKLALEKHYMGSYISEHPLDPFPYADFEAAKEDEVVKTTGIVSSVVRKLTKTGKEYLVLKIKTKDDIERTVNVFDTNQVLKLENSIKKNQIVIVKGKVSKKYNNLSATSVSPVAFKKQTIDTEDIEIETKTYDTPQIMPVSQVDFGNIF